MSNPTPENPLKNARLTRLEIQAMALHLHDGFSLQGIANVQGGDQAGVSRRLKNAIRKLMDAGMCPACLRRIKAKVTPVSKLGRSYVSGKAELDEL